MVVAKGEVYVTGKTGACVTILISIVSGKEHRYHPGRGNGHDAWHLRRDRELPIPFNTTADLEAASYLLAKGAQVNIISEVLVKEPTPEQVFLLHDVIRSSTVQNINGVDVVTTEAPTGELRRRPGRFSFTNSRDMENLNAVFALFRMDDRIYVIRRVVFRKSTSAIFCLSWEAAGTRRRRPVRSRM